MAVVLKEQMDSFRYIRSKYRSEVTRVIMLTGDAAEFRSAAGTAVAAHWAGVPADWDTLVVDGRTLLVDNKITAHVPPDSALVTVNYLWQVAKGGGTDPETDPGWWRWQQPFDEQFESRGQQKKTHRDLDGRPLSFLGEGVSLEFPRGIYSFRVLTHPNPLFELGYGKFNLAPYPPGYRTDARPFHASPRSLVLLGWGGGRSRRVHFVDGHYYPWEIEFRFAYDMEANWEWHSWTFPAEQKHLWMNPSNLYYWSVTQGELPYPKPPADSIPFKGIYPVYRKDELGRKLNPFWGRIREGFDFNSWGFRWL